MSRLPKPVISMPVALQRKSIKRIQKQRAKELEANHSKYSSGDRDSPPIIQCRRPELNHYKGQTYSPFKQLPMASEHWMSRSTIGDYFSFAQFRGSAATNWYKYVENPIDKIQFAQGEEIKLDKIPKPTFEEFDLDQRLVKSLKNIGIKTPTNIQYDSLPLLLSGESGLIASETGNGKTIAFLLPIIQKVLSTFEKTPHLRDRKFMSPLAVIVTPGRELAAQIKEVTEILVSDLDLKVKMSTGSFVQQKIEKMRREPVDILIGSVGGLNKMFDGSLYFADFVDTVVLDEVDTMIDETFQGVTSSFLARLRKKIEQQYIFAGATFPTTLDTSLGHVIDTEHLKIIQTPFLHKVMPHVYQKFIKTPKVARLDYLLDIIEPDVDKNRQVLIFSNKASTAAYISHSLNERRIPALLFSGIFLLV